MKVLILNKDNTNTTLNGTVKITIQSSKGIKMKCFYFKAPNFASKIDDITIGGYKYNGGINGDSYRPYGSL